MYLFGNGFRNKLIVLQIKRFGTNRHAVKEILFVDEILLQIDGVRTTGYGYPMNLT
jgi:hypothetical protein